MAIYHCSVRTFSRAQGHSAVAAAAYRAGSIIQDERTGRFHRYHNRTGVAGTFILAPQCAPENFKSRAFLWNAAEDAENRKNSRVAREVILALPHELSDKARAELSRDMGLYLMERYRVAVDVAIHSPCGNDPRNHHAHLLFTTREVTKDGLGAKTRILDDKVTSPQEIEIIREVWETLANDALARAGFADIKIDRRTLEDQGVDRIPQTHEGKASKNAATYESILARHFQKSGSEKEDEDEDGEKEGSGEKSSSSGSSSGTSSGSSSGSQSALTLKSKVREDSNGRKIDYPALDKKNTRSAFNAEIKALNEKRAAFGDKPLKVQIAQLDRLMEKLDRRVQKLQAIESKTSLKSVIKDRIKAAVKFTTLLVKTREHGKALQAFSKQEKHARRERQITRYGRNYREGLHKQIKEMKQNIAIVEAKRQDFSRYKSFVDQIDRDLKKHSPSITNPKKEPDQFKRQITDKEATLKLHLKAEMIRTNIPDTFKPKAVSAVSKVLENTSKPIRIDKTALNVPETRIEVKLDQPIKSAAPPARLDFKKATENQPTSKAQTEYKQPMTVRIKGIEQAIAQRQTLKPEERKSWFMQGGDKMKPFMQSVNKQLDEIYAKEPFAAPKAISGTGAMKDLFGQSPERRTTTAEFLANLKTKAEEMRAEIPERHRGKSYDDTTDHSFNAASKPPEEPKQPSFKLNKQFNLNSGATSKDYKSKPHIEPELQT